MSARTIIELVCAGLFAIGIWYASLSKDAPVGVYHEAQKAPELKVTPTETLTCKPITVYVPLAKQQTDLPPDIQKDTSKFVLDASTFQSSRHPQELVTIYDDKTGKVESLVRTKEYPWMQALQTGYMGVGYDFAHSDTSLFVHEDLLAIKALRFGVDASATRSVFAYGASVSYGW